MMTAWARTQPKRPPATALLDENRGESLKAPENRTVNHDRSRKARAHAFSRWRVRRLSILELEALGQLKVELDRRGLVLPPHSID